ncbi:hypothetical protein HZB05_00515 [Candidatus Wolfebacteria bacterium]|nr:hypothetical protein [Candidatus Wolfebacteria bacterium]
MLVELMVSISLLVVGFLGFLGLLSRALSLNRVVADQFIANYLTMEGIEITKNLIDSNIIQGKVFNDGFASDKCYELDYKTKDISSATEVNCLNLSNTPLKYDDSTNFYGYGSGTDTPFKRTVHIVPVTDEEIKVVSIVKWKSRGGIKNKIELEDHFFNWRP